MNKYSDYNKFTTSSDSELDDTEETQEEYENKKYIKGKPYQVKIIAKVSHDKDQSDE